MTPEVLCVGELLWDVLPDGEHLGGAPVNVAYHLTRLGRRAVPVTRVGRDARGRTALERLASAGVETSCVQLDPALPTGEARAELDARGAATYRFLQPAAWDVLECTPGLLEQAEGAAALVFGALAQRAPVSRATVQALAAHCRLPVFDVNLRPPHDELDVVIDSIGLARIAKLNEQEVSGIAAALRLPDEPGRFARALAERFELEGVCVTLGERGALLWLEGELHAAAGERVQVVDTVGAGDAFLAALIDGLLARRPAAAVLARANRLGAFVASRAGAMPDYDPRALL